MNNSPGFGVPHVALALVLIAFQFVGQAHSQDTLARWTNFDFAKQSLRSSDLTRVSLEDLKLMRAIVFGRHGRIFKDAEIQLYLKEQDWYKPNAAFQNSMLNNIERRNLDLIRIAEASKHPNVEP